MLVDRHSTVWKHYSVHNLARKLDHISCNLELLFFFFFFVPADIIEFHWWFSGMIIFHTSTQGFLNMKEALEKYGGSFLETMVNITK
jgi:hypothetical protein